MRPIRALIVISNLEYGGAQRQVVELANTADSQRLDVHLCSLSRYVPLAAELRERERLHVIRKHFKFDLSVVPRLARLLRALNADIVHGYLFDAEIAACLAGHLAGTPLVVASERNTDYRLKRRQLVAYRLTRGCLDAVIANSQAGAAFNSRTLGRDPVLYRVIRNGVDAAKFTPGDDGGLRRELGLADDERLVGMFGSFKAQKNHPLMFAAATKVLARLPRTRFLFVGDELYKGMHGSDAYKQRIDRLVDELGLRERCLFLGNRNDVVRCYRTCNLTVLPSLFEGMPNVVLESMACGVPVVVTDVSDNAMVAPDGKVGFVVRLGDEDAMAERIVHLLTDESLRQRMAREARRWVEQEFSNQRLAATTAAVYEELLEAARARQRSTSVADAAIPGR